MTSFLLPVPTHTVGTDLITVQYDRQMIPYLIGLLNASGQAYSFDPDSGDPIAGNQYIDTLITQLLTEVNMNPHYFFPVHYPLTMFNGDNTTKKYVHFNDTGAGIYNGCLISPIPAIGERWILPTYLLAGTYNFKWYMVKSVYGGIGKFGVYGYSSNEADLYNATTLNWQILEYLVPIANDGLYDLFIEVKGKNPSSGNYYMTGQKVEIIKTA